MIETLHEVAGGVANVDDWHREMLALADQAEAAGDSFAVQNLAEAAQFFLPPDVNRSAYESRMQEAWQQSWADASIEIDSVDYQGTALRVQRFPAQASKGTILMHGGFDGYYEQITTIAAALQDNGHEGPALRGPRPGLGARFPSDDARVGATRGRRARRLQRGIVYDPRDVTGRLSGVAGSRVRTQDHPAGVLGRHVRRARRRVPQRRPHRTCPQF